MTAASARWATKGRASNGRASNGRSSRVETAALLAAGVAADFAFDPAHRHVPLCPFHALTGWDCPLCGSLRAVDALVHGQFAAAAHDNVLLLAALPVLTTLWWKRPKRMPRVAVVSVIVIAVTFTVLRNLPGFAVLRP